MSSNSIGTINLTNKIRLVEESLRSPVYILGEEKWTIEERMAHYGVPGVSIAVVENNQILWAKSYGVSDKKSKLKATNKTLFQAASISKPITAYGALTMADEGLLDLNGKVNDYLKSWTVPSNELTQKQPVLLGQLLNHTAGLTVHGFPGYSVDENLPSLVQVLNGDKPANTKAIEVDLEPGTQFRYSGGGYTVLQKLMADVEGAPFSEIMENRVLRPLGMNDSYFLQPLPPTTKASVASGYLPDGSLVEGRIHIYPEMAAAGLTTTASDLAKFVIKVQEALRQIESPIPLEKLIKQMLPQNDDWPNGYGFFGYETVQGNRSYFSHSGWNAGFSSAIIGHTANGNGLVVLTNSNHPEFIEELRNSVADVYEWEDFLLDTVESIPFSKEEKVTISDLYDYSEKMTLRVFEENGKVFTQYRDLPKTELLKIGDNKYIQRTNSNRITFLKGSEGQVNIGFINSSGVFLEVSPVSD